MNGLSVLGQKEGTNLKIEKEFKSEFKYYKSHLLFQSARHDQTFPWNVSALKLRAFVQCVNNTNY